MRFRVTLEGVLTSSSGKLDETASKALTRTMAELNGLSKSVGNAAIDVNLRTGEILITCAVEAESSLKAIEPASDNIRLALFAGSIAAEDWPEPDDAGWRVDFINSRSEVLQNA